MWVVINSWKFKSWQILLQGETKEDEEPQATDKLQNDESSIPEDGEIEKQAGDGSDKEDFDEDSDDDVNVVIGDIKTSPTYSTLNIKRGGLLTTTTVAEKTKQVQQPGKFGVEEFDQAGMINGVPAVDFNLDSLEDKPWRKPGADITDYFNYGFNEDTWKAYCERQKRFGVLTHLLHINLFRCRTSRFTVFDSNFVLCSLQHEFSMLSVCNNGIVCWKGICTFRPVFIRIRVNESGVGLAPMNAIGLPRGPVPIMNDNSKYVGNYNAQRKVGPPPGRHMTGVIDVVGGSTVRIGSTLTKLETPKENVIQVLSR